MSMTPGTYEITCYQGATYTKSWNFKLDGVNIDWTGYTAKMQVRQYKNLNDTAVLTLQTGSGIAALTSNGNVAITITATQSGAITAGNYYYDIELTSGSVVERVLQGKFVVVGQVTA